MANNLDDTKPWITWKTLALAILGASGFLVQLWIGYVDKSLAEHVKRLYESEYRVATLEEDNRRLREDVKKMDERLHELCGKTRAC